MNLLEKRAGKMESIKREVFAQILYKNESTIIKKHDIMQKSVLSRSVSNRFYCINFQLFQY